MDATDATSGEANVHSSETDFGAEKGHIEGGDGPRPPRRDQLGVGGRVPAQQQSPQLVGVDHPRKTEFVGQAALPHPRGFSGAHVVVVDPEGDLTDQVLGVGELRDPQHDPASRLNGPAPGNALPEGWQLSDDR
jgi:hypothetical protein